MKTQNIVVALVLLVIGGGVYFFSTQNKQSSKTLVPTEAVQQDGQTEQVGKTSPSAETSTDMKVKDEVSEIVVSGSNFKFEPNTIKVKKGQKNKIVFKNIEGMHDFKVDELGISAKVIKTGEEESVEFTADKTGSFEYYCSVGQHRANGMKGTLVVE